MDPIDIPFESIWCLVCSRQIVPKRLHVTFNIPQHTPTPPPPPLILVSTTATMFSRTSHPRSTEFNNTHQQDAPVLLARGKTGTIRPRAQGLAHGTPGPNGAKDVQQRHNFKSAAPVPHRTVIDQTPAPLYCSDECRLADLQSIHSTIDIRVKYNPDRCHISPKLPPLPPNPVTELSSSQDDSDCSSSASYESHSPIFSPTTIVATAQAPSPHKGDLHADAYSRLSAHYGFAPLAPPPPFTCKSDSSGKESVHRYGIMMAARRIQAALRPEKPKCSSWGLPVHSEPEDANKPIPGWTDGSNAWRASVYGFAPPRDFTRTDPDDAAIRAYGSYVASPHRSHGVHSTLGEGKSAVEGKTTASTSSLPSRVVDTSTQELYSQFSASFTRRSESRSSIYRRQTLCTSPTGSARSALVREVSLLKPGAEGCLLVPDVKLRRVNSSVSSIDGSSATLASTPSRQSEEDDLQAAAAACSLLKDRPAPTGTWSYPSETYTYPIMRTAPKKERRIERKLVGGVEQDIVVVVLIEEPIKRLFLFDGARN
ncbi:hypothetical protein C8Q74DRAFT_1374237 [Fomes fomentarius]|nr:hypothetical protein C8Q74DRAFT_1374237 [Fomes fomentarius]